MQQRCTCSMACRVDTLPVMAATCRGVEPAGAVTSDVTSKSTVRTIIDAPPSSNRRTHCRLPLTAARCRAVKPFSALLSMYLASTQQKLSNCQCMSQYWANDPDAENLQGHWLRSAGWSHRMQSVKGWTAQPLTA